MACVGSPLPDGVRNDFEAAFDITFASPDRFEAALSERAADALLVTIDVRLDAARIAALPPRVRAIATYSVGLDHIDLQAAMARGLAVFNTPNVLAHSVADAALFLLLGAARRGTESIDLIRSRAWTGWNARQINGTELDGKRLGIYGMGSIGRLIARRALGFGMSIAYCNRTRADAAVEAELGGAVHFSDPIDMLAAVDALILVVPSTPQTRGFINAESLARSRRGLLLVNIARGDLVKDADLIAALEDGQVGAAGLDVFNGEPKLDTRYFDLPNVFMTPHIGSSTLEARRRMAAALVAGLTAWREGRRPPNQVC